MEDATGSPSSLLKCHCGREFTRIENLRRHQKTHSESKLQCDECGKQFTRTDVLKRHVKMHEMAEGVRASTPKRVRVSESVETVQPDVNSTTQNARWNEREETVIAGRNAEITSMQSGGPITMSQPHVLPISNTPMMPPSYTPQIPTQIIPSFDINAIFDFPTLLGSTSTLSQPGPSNYQTLNYPQPPSAASLTWDQDLLWGVNDMPVADFSWADFGISPDPLDISSSGQLDLNIQQTPYPMPGAGAESSFGLSRPASPPNDISEGDGWPSNYQPKQPFVIGAAGYLGEIDVDPGSDPELARWAEFWLDDVAYDRVKNSLRLAHSMPSAQVGTFQMPKSLWTVNTLISLYFSRFYPQLPILHTPTFNVSTAPPLLIASFMSIGATLSSISGSRAFAVDLIEIIRKTLAVLFELDSTNLRSADLIHVLVLTCFAGLWSGHQRSFELAELSRGMLINLCRRARLLESPSQPFGNSGISLKSNINARWRQWIGMESRKRLGLATLLLDSLFPSFLDTPSYLSQGEMLTTVLPCDERYWEAKNGEQWQGILGMAHVPPTPYFGLGIVGLLLPRWAHNAPPPLSHLNPFAALCLVNAMHHHIWEFRAQLSVYSSHRIEVHLWDGKSQDQGEGATDGFEARKIWLGEALDLWKAMHYNTSPDNPLTRDGRAFYHLGHIALNVQMRELFIVAGKTGVERAREVIPSLQAWTTTPDSLVATRHSLYLLSTFHFPTPTHARYAPTSIFIAILCLWVFIRFAPAERVNEAWKGDEEVERMIREAFGEGLGFGLGGEGRLNPIPKPNPSLVLKAGARYLGRCKEWRIGAALALVLAKLHDADPEVV